MVDRRLVEIPEPGADEPIEEYLDRLAVTNESSSGVPPPIIVPGGGGGGSWHSVELRIYSCIGAGADRCYGYQWRFNSSADVADMVLPVAATQNGSPTPYVYPAPALLQYSGGQLNAGGRLWNSATGAGYQDWISGTGAAPSAGWPIRVLYFTEAPIPGFSWFGWRTAEFSDQYDPKDFDVLVDGVVVCSVRGQGVGAKGGWRWYPCS